LRAKRTAKAIVTATVPALVKAIVIPDLEITAVKPSPACAVTPLKNHPIAQIATPEASMSITAFRVSLVVDSTRSRNPKKPAL